MDLLYSRAIPGPEFVSLSILLRSDTAGGDATPISYHIGGGGEPLLLSGSLSTVSQFSCLEALTELHFYINSILKATIGKNSKKTNESNSATKNTTTAGRFLKEDEKFMFAGKNSNAFATQIFRPKKCHGIAMQYHLIRDRKQLSSFLVPLILSSSKLHSSKTNNATAAAAPTAGFEMKEVAGVIFCVGMGGGPSAAFGVGTSPLTYSLSHRMKKCLYLLCGQTATETSDANIKRRNTGLNLVSARSLLTTLLLTDDEDRMVNSVVNGEQRVEINQEDQFTRRMSTINSKRRSRQQGMEGDGDGESPLQENSADQARIIVERLAVLSVYDTDSILRKYENRKAAKYTASTGKSGKKRLRKFARDADLDGFDFRGETRSSSTSNLDRNATNNSGGKAGGVDDISVSARSTFTNTSNLTLKGPKKDTASRTSINRSRQPITPGLLASSSKDSNSISRTGGRRNMHGRRSSIEQEYLDRNLSSSFVSPLRTPQGSVTSRNYQNQGLQHFDPFSGDPTGTGPSGGGTIAKALVNIALNEDLSCFYKVSKLSSCSVEGVIQVQARCNTDRAVPFSLLVRDPSKCIQSIQENKKYAEISTDHTTKSDYAFAVSVPKADEYFPVMRYKCGNELRPVPIRVQTRVRLEEGYWRVALQISSNPHNEDSLTDLTIIMGVPPEVKGESLTTSPAGGVWNASKRSVIWCVSELAGGEKFQLQARFETNTYELNELEGKEKPKFPVLVRCQCMYAQLSDIELEVRAIPQVMNADVKMKLARRFRLSHRERP
uniref:MHD domain-containing protein n=1 Tax=Pseudo-nitzschia australis TaxID=44445 RepID=A0A7S4AWU2_9STRA